MSVLTPSRAHPGRPSGATTRPAPVPHDHAGHGHHGSHGHTALNASAHVHPAPAERVIRIAPSVIRLGVGVRLAAAGLAAALLWVLTLSVIG
jgi:hypothetical protein